MPQELALRSHVRICDDVVFHDLQGELVLLNLKTGVYFGLDSVGTRIWHLLREHGSLQKVRDSLVEEYEVIEARCEHDLLNLVSLLRGNGLLEVCQ